MFVACVAVFASALVLLWVCSLMLLFSVDGLFSLYYLLVFDLLLLGVVCCACFVCCFVVRVVVFCCLFASFRFQLRYLFCCFVCCLPFVLF